jgi:hypothetical protein
MSDISSRIEWSDTLEHYFSSTGERCNGLAWCHKRAEAHYSGMKNYTELPVIILGVINGAASIGSNSLFDDPKFASIGVGLIALLTALLSTISSYFKWAQRSETHRISSLQYAKLYRYLSVQLGLPRRERVSPADMLRYIKDSFDRLAEISPLLPPNVIAEFNSKFERPEYVNLSKPEECNGLEAIVVYGEKPLKMIMDAPPADMKAEVKAVIAAAKAAAAAANALGTGAAAAPAPAMPAPAPAPENVVVQNDEQVSGKPGDKLGDKLGDKPPPLIEE